MSDPEEQPPERQDVNPPAPPPGSPHGQVDVIVTTRNDGIRLQELVEELPGDGVHELFIVDDGSTDVDTVRELDRLESGGYHVVRQDHRGLSRARNEGTRLSRAPFLLYLDAHTLPLEGFLPDATTTLHEDSTVAAVLADGRRQGGDEPIVVSGGDLPSVVAEVRFESCAVFRRSAIEKVGGWDEHLETGQDRDLFLSLAETGWSFAKLPSIGFTRAADDGKATAPGHPVSRADGIRIAQKHRELYVTHLTTVIGAYEAALAEAGDTRSAGSGSRGEPTVHDLMDRLAAVRSDLARAEADGVRARNALAAEKQSAPTREEVERAQQAQAVLLAQATSLDQELAALRATKTLRFLSVPRRVYAGARKWLR